MLKYITVPRSILYLHDVPIYGYIVYCVRFKRNIIQYNLHIYYIMLNQLMRYYCYVHRDARDNKVPNCQLHIIILLLILRAALDR